MFQTPRITRNAVSAALAALAVTAAAPLAAPAPVHAQGEAAAMQTATGPAPARSGHVQANGVSYYYEIHGQGEPLLLLHGGLGSIDMFGPVLPVLAQNRQVIGIDLHGHGRTALGDRPIRLTGMGDDVATVLRELGYGQVDVLGYSMGGGVAFRLAVQHPELVRRLALVSAGFAQDGFYPEMLPQQAQVGAAMAEYMKETPMYRSYAAIAPHPEDFPRLLDRMGEMMRQPYDFADDVRKLAMPVLLVFGDSDMYRPEHIVRFYQLLGGGLRDAGWQRENMSRNRLAIIPDATHYDIFFSPALPATVLPSSTARAAPAAGPSRWRGRTDPGSAKRMDHPEGTEGTENCLVGAVSLCPLFPPGEKSLFPDLGSRIRLSAEGRPHLLAREASHPRAWLRWTGLPDAALRGCLRMSRSFVFLREAPR
jgi:pimeloyl-ACP methyl ester carboxylesterase